MGKVATTVVMLCAASMLGSALIASQGFAPDPLPVEADGTRQAECRALDDAHAREDCAALTKKGD